MASKILVIADKYLFTGPTLPAVGTGEPIKENIDLVRELQDGNTVFVTSNLLDRAAGAKILDAFCLRHGLEVAVWRRLGVPSFDKLLGVSDENDRQLGPVRALKKRSRSRKDQ